MNRYHVIAVLGFFLGIFTAATLTLAWFGSPLAVVSGILGLITLWLVYSYIPEEGTPDLVERWQENYDTMRASRDWWEKECRENGYPFDHVGKQPKDSNYP